MTWMVSITWGTAAPQPGLTSLTSAAMIGFAAELPKTGTPEVVVNPVHIYSALELTDVYGLTEDDIVVKAATNFFNDGGTDLWVYVLLNEDNTETVSDTEFYGLKNSSNTDFYCLYAPVVGITNVEYTTNGTDWLPQTLNTHYTLIETFEGSGVYTGGISFVTAPPETWLTIRADVETSGTGSAIEALQRPNIIFNAFCFAYDQELNPTSSNIDDPLFRFKKSRCYSGKSWLGDILEGASAAQTLNQAGKRCFFIGALPDDVTPAAIITPTLADDTDYENDSELYGNLKNIVGTNPFVVLMVARQETDGCELAASTMGCITSDVPRKPFKYYPIGNLSQTTFPTVGEINDWDTAQINAIASEYFSNGSQFIVSSGNHTLGTGWEGDINYVRCKNILTNKLIDVIKSVLLTREVKFSSRGAHWILDTIDMTLDWAIANNYIDGKDHIYIPVMSYLDNESKLTEGELAFLEAERATNTFNNIEVAYKWYGDVDTIIISALVNT